MEKMLLEDCCEILDSQRVPITASDRKEGPYPYYGANGIQDYVADYIFDDELVLLAEDGGNFGSKERPIAYRVSGKCWVNNHAHVLKPKDGLDVDYLCYSLMFYNVGGMVNGATRQKLTQAAMRKMLIRKRSLEEQKFIVNIIKKVVSVKEKRQKELEKLDELIKARFVEMFGHPGKNEKGWKMNTFGDICTVRQGLQIPISKRLTEYEEGCYEYITVQYLHGGKEREYIKNPKETVICNKDDILMTRTGNTGMVITGVDGVFHNNFFLIDFDRSKYDKDFLVQYLNLDMIQADILRRAGTSTIPDLNHGEFYKIQVFEPPMALQVEFNYVLKQVDKSKVAVQKSLAETQKLFDSLMQEYFG